MSKNGYPPTIKCINCNGECCKYLPGATLPEDFGEPLLENLVKAFKSGKWAVDWWIGDPRGCLHNRIEEALFVRPKTKNGAIKIYDLSWGGECIFFVDRMGCSLGLNARPSGCRLLEPTKEECICHGAGKREAAIAWIPYNEIIIKAVKTVTKEEKDEKKNV